MNKSDYKILRSNVVFDSPKTRVVATNIRLPNGVKVEWHHVSGDEIVVAVVLDSEENIYLAKEWRAAAQDFIYSLPGGATKAETEEERLIEVNRELQEEIGYKGNNIRELGSVYSNAHNSRKFHIYLVTDLEKSKLKEDEGEIVEIERMPLKDVIKFLTNPDIQTTSTTIAGIFLAIKALTDQDWQEREMVADNDIKHGRLTKVNSIGELERELDR